jgi:hypothetical protein
MAEAKNSASATQLKFSVGSVTSRVNGTSTMKALSQKIFISPRI